MHATDPDVKPPRTGQAACTYCESSAALCRSTAWLRGRPCCEACDGNHDAATDEQKARP